MKSKLSDIIKYLKKNDNNASDTLFVSDPKDKRLKSYQDSSRNYNKRQSDLIRLKEVTDRFNRSGQKYKLKTSRYSDGGKEYMGYTFSTGDPLNPIATNATTEGTSVLSEKYKKPTQIVKYKKSDIVKAITSNKAADTLFVSDPKDKRLKSYQDSLSLYNRYKKGVPKGSFNYRKYKPEQSVPISGKINGIESYSGMGDPFAKDPIKPVGKYDFYRKNEAAYINGVYFPPQGEALSSGFLYKKPTKPVKYKKSEPKREVKKTEPVKKEQPRTVEKKQNKYEGSPVYSPGAGSGMPSALVGFMGKGGDTTYIKPEDYERFAVPKYGKAFIESKSKKK